MNSIPAEAHIPEDQIMVYTRIKGTAAKLYEMEQMGEPVGEAYSLLETSIIADIEILNGELKSPVRQPRHSSGTMVSSKIRASLRARDHDSRTHIGPDLKYP